MGNLPSGGKTCSEINTVKADAYALIDLHLHLDGSLSKKTVRQLAKMKGVSLPDSDAELSEKLQVGKDCRDLNEYLEKFDFTCALLQTGEAIRTAVRGLAEELKSQGLLYAEIRFAPQLHTKNGLSQSEVVQAAIDGIKASGFCSNLILCCMRGNDNHEQNIETVRTAKRYLGNGVCAIDIAGAEALYPTKAFGDLFELAESLGVPFTIHAGEAAGPESVYDALSFGALRLGHGVRAAEDGELMKRLADKGVTLELCPTSNLNTNVFTSIEQYPLRRFMDEGVRVTVNTDNMTVSGVSLKSELQKLTDTFKLSEKELKTLVKNAADASFADKETKAWLYGELEKRFGK